MQPPENSDAEDVPVPQDDFTSASNQATFAVVASTPTLVEVLSKLFSD